MTPVNSPSDNPFEGLAERYQQSRPDYPDDLLAHLPRLAGEASGVIRALVDVGAGTGIATRAFRRAMGPDWAITGVEPGLDMRTQAAAATPDEDAIDYIDGGAESLPVDAASVGVLTVAQAIQFFDRPVFYAQAERVLCDGGLLGILQNNRDWRASALLDAYETYAEANSDGYSRDYRDIDLMGEMSALDWAEPAMRFDHTWTLPMTPDRFTAMTLSRRTMKPAVAALGEAKVEADLTALAIEHADATGHVQIPYLSELFLVRKAAP